MSFSATPDTTTDSNFVCALKGWYHPACDKEPFYKEHEGKHYCVLHFPDKNKSELFSKALVRKLVAKDFSFQDIWFPDYISFTNVHFTSQADFSGATFNEKAHFLETQFTAGADFSRATFQAEVKFNASNFGGFKNESNDAPADFRDAIFNAKADFSYVKFDAVDFDRVTFNAEVEFNDTIFKKEADFNAATFKDYVRFARDTLREETLSEQSSISLQYARFDKPEHLSFHTLTLRPYWFVNVDARKFDFTNVDWDWHSTNEEVKRLKSNNISSPHRMLSIACRNLAVNAEENHRYEEASKFRYMAMDARRLESWRGVAPWRLSWWYWLASGYGERVGQATLWLLGIIILFAFLYILTGHISIHKWQDSLKAINYSLATMSLQKPEPKAVEGLTPFLITIETILGPLQAALLALAIRRKFMR